jgi:hypothetical protein
MLEGIKLTSIEQLGGMALLQLESLSLGANQLQDLAGLRQLGLSVLKYLTLSGSLTRLQPAVLAGRTSRVQLQAGEAISLPQPHPLAAAAGPLRHPGALEAVAARERAGGGGGARMPEAAGSDPVRQPAGRRAPAAGLDLPGAALADGGAAARAAAGGTAGAVHEAEEVVRMICVSWPWAGPRTRAACPPAA